LENAKLVCVSTSIRVYSADGFQDISVGIDVVVVSAVGIGGTRVAIAGDAVSLCWVRGVYDAVAVVTVSGVRTSGAGVCAEHAGGTRWWAGLED